MKTRAEVEALKGNWANDPCYDLESAEGFEEFHHELLAYRLETEARWGRARHAFLSKRARELGIPGMLDLVAYLETLEARVATLEDGAGG